MFSARGETFRADVADGQIEIARGEPDGADLVLTGSPQVIAAVVYGGQPIEALESAGILQLEGDRALAVRFATLFPLPAKAAPPT